MKKKIIIKQKHAAPKPTKKLPKHLGTRWRFYEVNFRDHCITKGYYLTADEAIWEESVQEYISLNQPYVAEPYPNGQK